MGTSPVQAAGPIVGPADDYVLMAGVAGRDSAALASLYDKYSGAVYALCLRALHDPRDAEDLLIDIFSEIWERGDRFDAARGSPIGHLMGLARSRVVDRLRSKKSAARVGVERLSDVGRAEDFSGRDVGPLDSAIFSEQRGRIVHALQTLPSEQRQALELAYYEALSHSEVAVRLGQPLGTVKSRIRQALIHLRDVLGQKS